MKKIRILFLCIALVLTLLMIVPIVLNSLDNKNIHFWNYTIILCLFMMILPILFLLYILTAECLVKSYTSPRYAMFCPFLIVIFGVGLDLLNVNFIGKANFPKWAPLMWTLFACGVIIPIGICIYLESRDKNSNHRPTLMPRNK